MLSNVSIVLEDMYNVHIYIIDTSICVAQIAYIVQNVQTILQGLTLEFSWHRFIETIFFLLKIYIPNVDKATVANTF